MLPLVLPKLAGTVRGAGPLPLPLPLCVPPAPLPPPPPPWVPFALPWDDGEDSTKAGVDEPWGPDTPRFSCGREMKGAFGRLGRFLGQMVKMTANFEGVVGGFVGRRETP